MGLLNLNSSYVYRGVEKLNLNIIGNSPLLREREIKSVIHRTIGDDNSYERIGTGDMQISIPIFVESTSNFNEIVDFFSNTKPFIFSYLGELSEPLNFVGNLKQEFFKDGVGEMTLIFTTAQGEEDLPFGKPKSAPDLFSKSNEAKWLDKLRSFGEKIFGSNGLGKKIFDFTSNANEKIGNFTNSVAKYSYALENIGNGVGGMSSIITNPINSIKNSASRVIGGIESAISGFQNSIQAILSVPSEINSIIDRFLLIGDQLNDLFNIGSKDDQLKQSSEFLGNVAESFITLSENQNSISPNIYYEVVSDTGEVSIEFRAEYFLDNFNNKGISVLLLSSILITMYQNAQQIKRWNTKDLDNLKSKTEAIYNYITSQSIPSDLQFQMDIARSDFFKIFKILYQNAIKTIELNLNMPKFLFDIIYEINGNFDYYYETKKLNNVVGGVVEGKIKIISNA